MSSPAPRPPSMRPTPQPRATREGGGAGYWPAVAIIAIMVATAGWTTVAVMAFNSGSDSTGVENVDSAAPDVSFDAGTDTSDAPVADTHDAPDLEALLPTQVGSTAMSLQSWNGDEVLGDGSQWADSINTYLGTVGKTSADLSQAQAYDATENTDSSINLYRLKGVPTASFRDALVAAWKQSYPDLAVTTVTLDGTQVTKGDFGQDSINSYWYEKDGLLYDIEAADDASATPLLQAVRDGKFGTSPGGSAGSAAPAASASPS